MAASVRIGTSGWEYRHWEGRFYPRELQRDRWLEHYASEFDTVELNNTFYRLPGPEQFRRWGDRVPARFRFAVKASRYLTHVKRLREPEEPIRRFWTRVRHLGPRRGPVLYQLPPRWKPDHDRLAAFLDAVPRAAQAVEIRDRRWYGDATFALLEGARVALVLHDMPGSATEPRPIGPLVYLRFHGAGSKYGGSYSSQRLSAWADRVAGWAREGLPVWAYFNNDAAAHAIRDADRLRSYVVSRLQA
jgi:uncharacterized protein YecE (DUF72 family)